jgi:SAM-dependent methyltransferase
MADWRIDHWDQLAKGDPDAAVLDPSDRHGQKNRYIAGVRNAVFLECLGRDGPHEVLLDFGCGSGSCSAIFESLARRSVGIDISFGLLKRAKSRPGLRSTVFVHYDGIRLPLAHESIDAVAIYVVLSYVDDATAVRLLASLRGCTRDGGRLCMIEQSARSDRLVEGGLKHLRSPERWKELLSAAGWRVETYRHVRFGRFPTTPLIRWGLLPQALHGFLGTAEAWLGRRFGPAPWDYAETLFEARR